MVHTELTPEVAAQYQAAAAVWGSLRREFLHALGQGEPSPDSALSKKRGGHLWRVFWAAHQRFFRHMVHGCQGAAAAAAAAACSLLDVATASEASCLSLVISCKT